MNQPKPLDPALLRGLTQRRVSRRDVLRISGLGAFTMAVAAACGVKGTNQPAPDLTDFWSGKVINGHVDIATWEYYMDAEHTQLQQFQAETGITWTYDEVIVENGPWYEKVRPDLSAGRPIGYDLMVITNGNVFAKFKKAGWLAPLDHSKLVNYNANVAPSYKTEAFDPGNVYSVPYTSGLTGLGYRPDLISRPITKLADLWDPTFTTTKPIGLMSDVQELGNLGMLALGIDPPTSTPDDWHRAADKLKELTQLRQVIKVDQDNVVELENGNLSLAMAWSGDMYQSQINGTDLQFLIAEEGVTIWTDNMVIPYTATNPVDAITYMDFLYKVDVQAKLQEYISYISPVPAIKAIVEADAAAAPSEDVLSEDDWWKSSQALTALLASPIAFPTDELYAKFHTYRDFATAEEEQEYEQIFQPIL